MLIFPTSDTGNTVSDIKDNDLRDTVRQGGITAELQNLQRQQQFTKEYKDVSCMDKMYYA